MDHKQITTFLKVAEALNFTKAAQQLNFAQSSVTAHIRALEEEFDKPLFERLGKKIKLTSAGLEFHSYAERLLKLTAEAKQAMSASDEPEGVIVIGAQESQCTYRLPPILKEFKTLYPKVKLVFKPAHSDNMARQQLMDGGMDVAFFMDVPKAEQSLTIETLATDSIKLVASPNHILASHPSVDLKQLEGDTFLLTEAGCSYRNLFEQSCQNADVYPINQFEFGSIEAIKQCVIADLGVALLPEMVVEKDIERGDLIELNWHHDMPPVFTKMAWHKDKWMSPPLLAFTELTRTMLS
ncbi:LysR family transcriptional regulator [Halobacillus salinus]|uniref:LysR family transcriptional regulator n=1 Tax=Halobacillus salinus TaxID=192814 RepID=UPI0009A643EC|nr:LysR family transcriptional regulator [Halobacillus salinus]